MHIKASRNVAASLNVRAKHIHWVFKPPDFIQGGMYPLRGIFLEVLHGISIGGGRGREVVFNANKTES